MSPRPGGNVELGTHTGISEFLYAGMSQQNTNLGLNDHVKFDIAWAFRGGLYITLDALSTYTTTLGAPSLGRFKLKAGPSYLLQAGLGFVQQSGATAQHVFAWYVANATGSGTLGSSYMQVQPYTLASDYSEGNTMVAVITPAVETLVEVRLVESVAGSVNQIGLGARSEAWALIQTI